MHTVYCVNSKNEVKNTRKKSLQLGEKHLKRETEREEKNTLMRRGKVCECIKRPLEHRYIVQMYRACGRWRQMYETSAVMGIKR
jgi:hypothetical protein